MVWKVSTIILVLLTGVLTTIILLQAKQADRDERRSFQKWQSTNAVNEKLENYAKLRSNYQSDKEALLDLYGAESMSNVCKNWWRTSMGSIAFDADDNIAKSCVSNTTIRRETCSCEPMPIAG